MTKDAGNDHKTDANNTEHKDSAVVDSAGNNTAGNETAGNNRVHLTGRVSAEPESRILPSGDEIVSFRLVGRRSAAARRRSKQVVDTIECTVWRAALRRSVARLAPGTDVTVSGELRRRFSRGGGGVASWVSVEVDSCRRVAAPAVASKA